MLIILCRRVQTCLLIKSIANRNISSTSILLCKTTRNFYEILGIKNQECTQKEIKNAFINLSKQYHPDSNAKSTCDKNFKEILEAYQVLSKPHSRSNYDLSLKGIHTVNYVTRDTVHRPWESSNERRYEPADENNYYGIKGIKKMANWKIVLACFIFCGMGIIAQIIAIRKSLTFKRQRLDEQTSIYNAMHRKVREEALRNSDISNLQRVVNRMRENEDSKK
ncbi:hypothetical protein PVAND_005977 [Polypedilum vanderplanki]|uniref:J domain-containing protein n=1 Tax=Polypedilum vanderplanki TaxID=319348 RepID=A0A9J6C1S3_POLVA|nr:hypothetical protein PVAND_005977 [Polypedilum vanderplanki]